MNQNVTIILVGLLFLLVGVYMIIHEWKKLRRTQERDMLWASRVNLFTSGVLCFIVGSIILWMGLVN